PPPGVKLRSWYLGSSGSANSVFGDGVLTADAPPAGTDHYTYDPHNPAPSFGGRHFRVGGSRPGPFDQRRVEERADVLVYTSDVLTEPVEAVGDARLVLQVTSSTVGTDYVAKICDVMPDGI